MADDDAARRQEEINMFAAMAQGEGTAFSSGTFDLPSSSGAGDCLTDSLKDPTRIFLAQASMEADASGTFNFQDRGQTDNPRDSSDKPAHSFAKNHNLEAAAAALADDDEPDGPTLDSSMQADGIFMAQHTAETQQEKFPRLAPRSPMHTQHVYLPKPLFFGCHLPPHVVEEAKKIVRSCPKDVPYPPEVRNLLSAVRTYGHGLDLLKEDSRSTPYVSVFCPKWSELSPLNYDGEQEHAIIDESPSSGSFSESQVAAASAAAAAAAARTHGLDAGTGRGSGEGGATPSAASLSVDTKNVSERDLFSRWARGDDSTGDMDIGGAASPSNSVASEGSAGATEKSSLDRENSLGSVSSLRRNFAADNANESSDGIMSDRDLFSQWARGESPREEIGAKTTAGNHGNSMVFSGNGSISNSNDSIAGALPNLNDSVVNTGSVKFFNSGTFMNLPSAEDSDDDELVVSELKKKVGVNEHLNAALAYLEEDQNESRNARENAEVEESANKLAQVPLTSDGGRPLTNHELMNGIAPLFGFDDSPLPTEADLGIHETRDEQQRSREQRRNQAVIENFCPQNIFGPLACPDPAINPDDNHSWNSRATPPSQARVPGSGFKPTELPRTVAHAKLGVLPNPEKQGGKPPGNLRGSTKPPSSQTGGNSTSRTLPSAKAPYLVDKRLDPRSRYGWWNVPVDEQTLEGAALGSNREVGARNSIDIRSVESDRDRLPALQLPPLGHAASNVLVQTKLEPRPEMLQEQNRPLSQLHPATTLAQSLPYLCDRPPSYRYLQVDTQAVGFLGLGGEVEPLFCSLAIYNVETLTPTTTKDPSLAPIPDLQRCGKVTESLSFDVVSDPNVEKRCHGSLWPYKSNANGEKLQGTRCGVFPLPSNLNIHNLYAILVVHKVVSEGNDFEAYLRSGRTISSTSGSETTESSPDLELLRSRAEKASNNQGKFIMPFAFGVAPLLQVFGADVPVVPSSRAVQIPLFRFSAGLGDRQIIDHIMVMLYPRADHRGSGMGGPAPVTNRGTAMLVMRNFGHLGLHSVVSTKSSLARDRLVNFTREIQLRRREDGEEVGRRNPPQSSADRNIHVVAEWHSDFVAEPTVDGGRNKHLAGGGSEDVFEASPSISPLYAQELAPLYLRARPLPRSPTSSFKPQRGRGQHHSGEDIEPYFRTSYCNELLCYPRLLRNCPKGNIVIKVELRDVEWLSRYNVTVAHLPEMGPSVHNPRRGPSLVQGVYSSCSARCLDPYFLDEFKVKLPLVLNGISDTTTSSRKLSMFFTVFRLSFSTRKKWGKRFRTKKGGKAFDEIAGDIAGESSDEIELGPSCHLIQLASGYLPLVSNTTILSDGNHDIKLTQISRLPKSEFVQKGELDESTLILTDIPGAQNCGRAEADDLLGEDTESVGSSYNAAETASATSASESVAVSEVTESSRSRGKQKTTVKPICLQVRVAIHSSIHCQNSVLNEFLGQEPANGSASSGNQEAITKMLDVSPEEIRQQISPYVSASVSDTDTHHDNEKLLISCVDLSKTSMCPVPDVFEHLLRVGGQLWQVIVFGTAEPNLKWSNPAYLAPLRLQAFASLLQILGSTALYSSRRGLTQLDGSTKWNIISLGRVFALMFDEGRLFGECASEVVSRNAKSVSATTTGAGVEQKGCEDKRRRHTRSNFEFLNNIPPVDGGFQGADLSLGGQFDGGVFSNDFVPSVSRLSSQGPPASPYTMKAGSNGDSQLGNSSDDAQSPTESMKVDSVTDFRSALKTGSEDVEDDGPFYDGSSTGSRAALALVKAYSGPQAMSRRWMTAPSPGLATIREDGDGDYDASAMPEPSQPRREMGPLDSLDTELYIQPAKKAVKQFRVPKVGKKCTDGATNLVKGVTSDTSLDSSPVPKVFGKELDRESVAIPFESRSAETRRASSPEEPMHLRQRSDTLPSTDAEIEKAGTFFLDAVEMSRGLGGMIVKGASTGEEDRVGQAHHRKTRSSCSIDWSIPNDDLGRFVFESTTSSTSFDPVDESKHDFDESMTTLSDEFHMRMKLPTFWDRLMAMKASPETPGRWFPFTYEVIIMQWAAILNKQRKPETDKSNEFKPHGPSADAENHLMDAASRTGGVAIACAPVLFEIIKQSIGWRVNDIRNKIGTGASSPMYPPLATLDKTLMANLEEIIESITLASIDFRNFDSWETRQTCIDVNDSIVLFLRDLFAFLDTTCTHRLMMIYLSNLLGTNDRVQDRDSTTGLRCSWEATKLQLNAVTALVRFPDLVKVNSPQFNSLGEALFRTPNFSAVTFFDELLDTYQKFNFKMTAQGDSSARSGKEIPTMKPHWLVEIIVDICILGTEHAEQNIQRRASSLLFEMLWGQSQASMLEGHSSIVASMHVTFLEKVLARTNYISRCFSAKSQVRQDIFRSVVFVLQSAPGGLLRALWRKFCARSTGKGSNEKYGSLAYSVVNDPSDESVQESQRKMPKPLTNWKQDVDIFEMFSLLNLALSTLEYEGSDEHAEADNPSDDDGPHLAIWRKEFVLVREQETSDKTKRRRLMAAFGKTDETGTNGIEYSTTSSRRWHSHDGAIVLIKTAQQIVRELRSVLEPTEEAHSLFNPARRKISFASKHRQVSSIGSTNSRHAIGCINLTYMDTVIFVRAATSVYLHSLTLQQSDITLVKTLNASLEIVKIFGIKIFNEAVGETLQHWMRVVSFHCGSRRAEVRVQASDFLELVLRSTWDSFGSFFRIRLPLLAVQTEVMERIVATAAGRHYREQRMMGLGIDLFSNGNAEASLAPLWRTLDRLHHQSASQNVAFRSALMRLAEKVKKLFRAYVAAHALSFLNQGKAPGFSNQEDSSLSDAANNLEVQTLIRASRISVHRVINASAGYSKQFLGFYSTSLEHSTVAHNEAVEDAFLAAADVFSPTELPDHRVAWLRRLAKFHFVRHKYAEEATCHYGIHITLQRASSLHGALWFSTPFLPWTNNKSDGMHLDGEGPAFDSDDAGFDDPYDDDSGRQIEKTNSFRRIFYRNENSIRVSGGELEAGTSKYAFYGVTLPSEYSTVSPWTSMREMEASMLEEAEAAGHLFLKAGIVASSRCAWSLAVRHYAEKFSYGKLKHVYERLANTVVSEIPPLDTNSNEVSITVPLGRFYRVWFHGGAPDELIGAEFVYRTASNVKLETFGKELKEVIRCIIPDKTPIHLVLDGRAEEREAQHYSGFRMGAQLEPVKVKVTPLRSLVRKSSRMRGVPEWFHDYIETAFSGQVSPNNSYGGRSLRRTSSIYSDGSLSDTNTRPRHREHGPTYSASVFSSSSNSLMATRRTSHGVGGSGDSRRFRQETYEGELVGADKFSFMQPINQGRGRGTRDWLWGSSGDFAAKTLRVTQLQVGQAFPACVSRQAVVHRVVFTQSPLEAAGDSICQWCAILFRTAIATNGQAVLGTNYDPGIGIEAAKVVSDCIHSSRVKEMGLYLLKKNTNFEEEDEGDALQSYDRLAEDEVKKLQLRLARSLVVFMELIHLMIARNREVLLEVIQERKRGETGSRHSHSASLSRGDISLSDARSNRSVVTRQSSLNGNDSTSDMKTRGDESTKSFHRRKGSASLGAGSVANDDYSLTSAFAFEKARTDSAIGIQSELQRAFISLAKELHPKIAGIMKADTPRWLKQCTHDNYFSAYTYRHVKIPMEEELAFEDLDATDDIAERPVGLGPTASSRSQSSLDGAGLPVYNAARSSNGTRTPVSPGGSLGSGSVASRSSDAGRSQQSSKKSVRSYDRIDRILAQDNTNRMASN